MSQGRALARRRAVARLIGKGLSAWVSAGGEYGTGGLPASCSSSLHWPCAGAEGLARSSVRAEYGEPCTGKGVALPLSTGTWFWQTAVPAKENGTSAVAKKILQRLGDLITRCILTPCLSCHWSLKRERRKPSPLQQLLTPPALLDSCSPSEGEASPSLALQAPIMMKASRGLLPLFFSLRLRRRNRHRLPIDQ
jgi:hypothetical protein